MNTSYAMCTCTPPSVSFPSPTHLPPHLVFFIAATAFSRFLSLLLPHFDFVMLLLLSPMSSSLHAFVLAFVIVFVIVLVHVNSLVKGRLLQLCWFFDLACARRKGKGYQPERFRSCSKNFCVYQDQDYQEGGREKRMAKEEVSNGRETKLARGEVARGCHT